MHFLIEKKFETQEHAEAQAEYHALIAVLQQAHQECRQEGSLTGIPESVDESMDDYAKLVAPLEEELTSPLKEADTDLSVIDINICNAIKNKTLSKKDAIVTQLRPK